MNCPYAYSADIKHEYSLGTLSIYLTFFQAMKTHREVYPDPTPIPVIPDNSLWYITIDGTDTVIDESEWQDDFTLLLKVNDLTTPPSSVQVSFDEPSPNLITFYTKQIEPFIKQPSFDLTALLLPAGMIVLWSGAIVDIPSGWLLCDGSNGTPDLRSKFVYGAGTVAVGTSGGSDTHNHTATQNAHNHALQVGGGVASGGNYMNTMTFTTPAITVANKTVLPPYYALAYIQKA